MVSAVDYNTQLSVLCGFLLCCGRWTERRWCRVDKTFPRLLCRTVSLMNAICIVVRHIIKRTKVTAQLNEGFGNHPRLFLSHLIVCSIHLIYLKYPGGLSNGHFPAHPISKSLQCSVSHSINPFLSDSLSSSSAYSPLYLYQPSFDLNRKLICVSGFIE